MPCLDPFRHVAPLGTRDLPNRFVGRARRKPWQYNVTACVPHLATPELIGPAVELLRLQTERPYILLIDTGSPPDVCRHLEAYRAEDLEVHFVRGHGYIHSSEPVAVALDLGHALCRTRYLYHTHCDVFPTRPDLVAWLLGQCGEACPVVGWEMSPRNGTDRWRGAVSHTCTMLYMPTIRRLGATWSFQRYYEAAGLPSGLTVGFPDTETTFNHVLRAAGVVPKLLGREVNYQRQQTDWWDHARSLPGLRAYSRPDEPLLARAESYAADAVREARARVAAWRAGNFLAPPAPAG